jgi:hypothetical protein
MGQGQYYLTFYSTATTTAAAAAFTIQRKALTWIVYYPS